jgi:hypothetical protein
MELQELLKSQTKKTKTIIMNHIERTDPLTGEIFIAKRNNQRFSKPQHRAIFHNRKANQLRRKLSTINEPLLRNYKVLVKILSSTKEKTLHRERLIGMGYNFAVFTNYQLYDERNRECIYGIIIIPLENNLVKIVML